MNFFKTIFSAIFLTLSLAGPAQARTVIISDIDDTLKQTNNMGGIKAGFYFLKSNPFEHLCRSIHDLVGNLKARGEEVEIFYLSAGYDFLLDQEKMLKKFNLPDGKVILKKLSSPSTYSYKYSEARSILTKAQERGDLSQVFLFGDNSSQDHNVYSVLNKELNLNAQIYIRDVATWATSFAPTLELETKLIPGVTFFFSEKELLTTPLVQFLSEETKNSITESFTNKNLVPNYTEKTLRKRLRKHRHCVQQSSLDKTIACNRQAKKDSKAAMEQYYQRQFLTVP